MISASRDSISCLDPITQGETLSEKAVDVHLVEGREMIARWYHSPYESDLMIWFDSNGVVARFQLNSSGQITDWSEGDGLQTGLIVEIEIPFNGESKSSLRRRSNSLECAETIQFDAEMNNEVVIPARELIAHGAAIPMHARAAILEILGRSWPRERKLRTNASRTRFWGRFKRWTTGT